MKKELVIAIFIGLVIGFGIAAVFWSRTQTGSLNLSLLTEQSRESQVEVPTPTPESTDKKIEDIPLNITQPDNEIIHPQENLTVTGKTLANTTVVIIWEEGEDILVADEEGEFKTEITLVGGENRIDISAYTDDGTKTSQTLTVTYSTAEF